MNDPYVKTAWKVQRAIMGNTDEEYEARLALHSLVWEHWALEDRLAEVEKRLALNTGEAFLTPNQYLVREPGKPDYIATIQETRYCQVCGAPSRLEVMPSHVSLVGIGGHCEGAGLYTEPSPPDFDETDDDGHISREMMSKFHARCPSCDCEQGPKCLLHRECTDNWHTPCVGKNAYCVCGNDCFGAGG